MSKIENEQLKVEEEDVLICEKCHTELGFVLYFKKTKNICPTCHNQADPNSCWLLCRKCRGAST